MGTGGPFPGGKARPGLDADHSPTSSTEVKNDKELVSLPISACMAVGQLYFFIVIISTIIIVAVGMFVNLHSLAS
jgi:hypothetical protein